jgi:hypothetical protein
MTTDMIEIVDGLPRRGRLHTMNDRIRSETRRLWMFALAFAAITAAALIGTAGAR